MMKQPELGRKILELRQQKGLTQEELVAQCNISVRTIQRIEAGEVSPRSYTIRTILDALDYDLSQLQSETSQTEQRFKELLLLDVNTKKEASFLIQQLNIAWIAAIVYFFITIPDMLADFSLFIDDEPLYGNTLYILIKILVILSYVFFFRGLILTGRLFQNYLLKITAFLMLFTGIIFYGYDILAIAIPSLDFTVGFIAENISFGLIGILFGIGLLRLKGSLRTLGLVAGILEISASAFFLLTLGFQPLGFVGLMLWSVAIIMEIILLYKVTELIKQKEREFHN